MDKTEIHVTWGDDFVQLLNVFILIRDEDGKATRVELKPIEKMGEAAVYSPATGVMTREAGQWLFNRLWELGFRNRDDSDKVYSLASQLSDAKQEATWLRSLVAQLLERVLR